MVEKSKICFIINSFIKQLDREDDAILAKLKLINKELENNSSSEHEQYLREELVYNHGVSIALGSCQKRLEELLQQIKEDD